MKFYLGTHRPSWLHRTDVPLFVSAVTLRGQRTIRAARGPWAIDSGGFSELSLRGCWTIDDRELASDVQRWGDQARRSPDFAAPRDWMCEPWILAKTGKTISEHQARTIESVVTLRALAPRIRWLPVLQGWHPDDYESHAEQYRAAGIELRGEPRVGVGSVCRRQGTAEGAAVFNRVADLGIRAHAFGVKVDGLALYGHRIASADSMAWSFVARRRGIRMAGCSGHANCANCMRWALEWHRTRILGQPATAALAVDRPDGRTPMVQRGQLALPLIPGGR